MVPTPTTCYLVYVRGLARYHTYLWSSNQSEPDSHWYFSLDASTAGTWRIPQGPGLSISRHTLSWPLLFSIHFTVSSWNCFYNIIIIAACSCRSEDRRRISIITTAVGTYAGQTLGFHEPSTFFSRGTFCDGLLEMAFHCFISGRLDFSGRDPR